MSTIILGIESSCDDTSAAVIKDGVLLSSVIASQAVHEAYGGVVPELASRAHQQNIVPVVHEALKRAGVAKEDLSAIAFTRGPGLMGSLLVGVSFAKGLARSLDIPMVEVNHLQGHVLAHFIQEPDGENVQPKYPFICLLVSGGNAQIIRANAYNEMEVLGQTIDDAAGEAIDIIECFQQEFLEKYGTRLVFPSDEFYLIAKRPLHDADFYEEYPQYENGVGTLRSLYDEFESALKLSDPPEDQREVSIATGAAAFGFISGLAQMAEQKYKNLKCRVYKIVNDFFGETITVAGLLTAQDIMAQLKDEPLGTELLLTKSMIMRDSDIFLDDITIPQVEEALGVKIRLTDNDGFSLLDGILGVE